MNRTLFGLIVASVLGISSSAIAQTVDIADLHNTGVDDTDMPLSLGTDDTHWEVQEDALGWQTPLFEHTNLCRSCGSIWVAHPIGNNDVSRPLAHPSHVRTAAPGRLFSWRTTFTLPDDADVATATISYNVGYDDLSRNAAGDADLNGCNHTVWLNDTAIEITSAGDNIRTECVGEIPAGSAFVAGENTLEFRISNIATYYGFRFEKQSATYEQLPEPVAIDMPANGTTIAGREVTVTGTGEPGTSVTVTIGNQEEIVMVGPDGSWAVMFTDVPFGEQAIAAEGADGSMASVTVTFEEPAPANNNTGNNTTGNNTTGNNTTANNTTGNSTTGNNGTGNNATSANADTGGNGGGVAVENEDGCGCGSASGGTSSVLLLAFGLVALRLRRRRQPAA